MDWAIDLDHEQHFGRVEVRVRTAQPDLLTEPHAELPATEALPERTLRLCTVTAQVACTLPKNPSITPYWKPTYPLAQERAVVVGTLPIRRRRLSGLRFI